jgi:3-hydroxyisobutyrate dehydrogenase-like beta-hydroxyacid dehydrogenase
MTAKLAHQVILCLNMLAAHEGNELARRAGLDPGMLGEAVGAGAAQSRIADRWARARPTVQNGAPFRKDLALALELAHEVGLELPATALIQQSLEEILGETGRRCLRTWCEMNHDCRKSVPAIRSRVRRGGELLREDGD